MAYSFGSGARRAEWNTNVAGRAAAIDASKALGQCARACVARPAAVAGRLACAGLFTDVRRGLLGVGWTARRAARAVLCEVACTCRRAARDRVHGVRVGRTARRAAGALLLDVARARGCAARDRVRSVRVGRAARRAAGALLRDVAPADRRTTDGVHRDERVRGARGRRPIARLGHVAAACRDSAHGVCCGLGVRTARVHAIARVRDVAVTGGGSADRPRALLLVNANVVRARSRTVLACAGRRTVGGRKTFVHRRIDRRVVDTLERVGDRTVLVATGKPKGHGRDRDPGSCAHQDLTTGTSRWHVAVARRHHASTRHFVVAVARRAAASFTA